MSRTLVADNTDEVQCHASLIAVWKLVDGGLKGTKVLAYMTVKWQEFIHQIPTISYVNFI